MWYGDAALQSWVVVQKIAFYLQGQGHNES